MNRDVTVVTGTFPSRSDLLVECKESVAKQTHPVVDHVVVLDHDRTLGCWGTRNVGIMKVETEWTAFLDDDDLLLPHHIEFLLNKAEEHELDIVVSWFEVIGGMGGKDPFPHYRYRTTWDPNHPHCFPIPVIVRTRFLHTAYREMGGFANDYLNWGSWDLQDLPVWMHVIRDQGAKYGQFPDITWLWRHNGRNSGGLPNRGN